MSLIVDEHREYLADEPRVRAFSRAIEATIRPGDVVLDLGSGTGILALLACRAGASRVYAIEAGGIVGLARELARANGREQQIVFVQELSTRAQLPEHVDAILTDQIGRFGFDAGLAEYMPDARRRWLKPGGRVVPGAVNLWVVPVEHHEQWSRVTFWRGRPAGFDFDPASALAVNTGYPVKLDSPHLLGPLHRVAALPLAEGPAEIAVSCQLSLERGGTLHGLGGGFEAELSPGVRLSNSPFDPQRINRRNVFLPIDPPVTVAAGDRIDLKLRVLPIELVVAWRGTVYDRDNASKGRFRGSTFEGMLVPAATLRRTDLASVPTLSPSGEARRSILDLCDGRRTLAEIEAEVFRRHQTLFETPGRAAAFVAEVITRYAG